MHTGSRNVISNGDCIDVMRSFLIPGRWISILTDLALCDLLPGLPGAQGGER